MINALSFDVEDYFQVTGFEHVIDRSAWGQIAPRFQIGLGRILDILDRHGTRATFFFLGWIADHHPDSVTRVAARGHEIAIHGYEHRLIYDQTEEAFEADIRRAIAAVRKSYGGPLIGHRAPSFSICEQSLWALDILKQLGFQYDSSIFPFKRRRYGIKGAPTRPHEIRQGLWEFPLSTVGLFGKAIPVCGGGYFRLYPYFFTRKAIRHLNESRKQPAIVYIHPWELDPDQPTVAGASFGNTFRHRVNLDKTGARLEALCRDFSFAPIREILGL
jgi:polysaccharide deacetylase family protein (PEP-CTERM system associated)